MPWMYTGGLENVPWLIDSLSRARPLWGCDSSAVRKARSPAFLSEALKNVGISSPAFSSSPPDRASQKQWLQKPLLGAGGIGIQLYNGNEPPENVFFQEWIPGQSCSAVFIATQDGTTLYGILEQLIGQLWLHKGAFHYCGNLGPSILSDQATSQVQQLGRVVASECGLRGIFGIDFILQDDTPWLVEVNPRYTASVEVLEYALGLPLLALHRIAFDPSATIPAPSPTDSKFVGKAIYYAPQDLLFPEDGPWELALQSPFQPFVLPPFADIPLAGEVIKKGHPVLTLLAQGETSDHCRLRLQRMASSLDNLLLHR